jgi:hypothetical protein
MLNWQRYPGCVQEGLFGVNVTTFAVNEDLLVAGGFHGELICKVSVSYKSAHEIVKP